MARDQTLEVAVRLVVAVRRRHLHAVPGPHPEQRIARRVGQIRETQQAEGNRLPPAGMLGQRIVPDEVAQREGQPSLRSIRQGHVVLAGGQASEFVAHFGTPAPCPLNPFMIG